MDEKFSVKYLQLGEAPCCKCGLVGVVMCNEREKCRTGTQRFKEKEVPRRIKHFINGETMEHYSTNEYEISGLQKVFCPLLTQQNLPGVPTYVLPLHNNLFILHFTEV